MVKYFKGGLSIKNTSFWALKLFEILFSHEKKLGLNDTIIRVNRKNNVYPRYLEILKNAQSSALI